MSFRSTRKNIVDSMSWVTACCRTVDRCGGADRSDERGAGVSVSPSLLRCACSFRASFCCRSLGCERSPTVERRSLPRRESPQRSMYDMRRVRGCSRIVVLHFILYPDSAVAFDSDRFAPTTCHLCAPRSLTTVQGIRWYAQLSCHTLSNLTMSFACLNPPSVPATEAATQQASIATTNMLPDSAMTPADDGSDTAILLTLQASEAEASLAICKLTIHAQQEQLDMIAEERQLHTTQLSMLRVSNKEHMTRRTVAQHDIAMFAASLLTIVLAHCLSAVRARRVALSARRASATIRAAEPADEASSTPVVR